MGHANYTNLCLMFVRLLYAKGCVSIADAVAVAGRRGETLHASEGGYDAETGMVGMALDEYCSFLASKEWARKWSGRWDGPYIVADLSIYARMPKSFAGSVDWFALLAGLGDHDEARHGVIADFVQERGHDAWAAYIRILPALRQILPDWLDPDVDTSEQWELTEQIPWRFAKRWRMRYKDVPIISNVTH